MTAQQQLPHWRDELIAKSEAISDAWQVALAYAGRFAEIILFLCMVINIIEMVPTIHVWSWLSGGTLIVQMITLDIAGFGLNSMAKHVRRGGDEETAKKAEHVGNLLIGIMIISLINVTINLLFGPVVPGLSTILGYVDDVLILARVVSAVFYGHIIHSLREAKQYIQAQQEQKREDFQEEITKLQQALRDEKKQAADLQAKLQAELQEARADFALQLQAFERSQHMTLQTAESQNGVVATLQNQLRDALQQARSLTANVDQKQRDLDTQTTKLQTILADLQSAKMQIIDLQNQLREAKQQAAKSPVKASAQNITSLEQARAKHEANGSGKARVSHAEIQAFKAANPTMRNADIAAQLGVSERTVYGALSAKREQPPASTDAAAQ